MNPIEQLAKTAQLPEAEFATQREKRRQAAIKHAQSAVKTLYRRAKITARKMGAPNSV